jgi:taurine dioxygenase
MEYRHIGVRPISGVMGAEIDGPNLAKPLDDAVFDEIARAFGEHCAVFFRNQDLSRDDQMAFGRRFGPLDVHPIAHGTPENPEVIRVLKPAGESASFGVGWHSDNSFFEQPSLATCLYAETVPPYGGDTLFASMERAYDALSDTLKTWLDGTFAIHSASRAYDPRATGSEKYEGKSAITYSYTDAIHDEVVHPVVRTHPVTGRKSIYVNPMFTQSIQGLHASESDALLALLFEHCARPDFTCRFRWVRGSFALWDNRCVKHYAHDDYREFERLLYRVTITGDRPR